MQLQSWYRIFDILRDLCIDNVRVLKGSGILVGNPNTYGEITPKFIQQIIEEVGITSNDIFYDIGSGIGNVVLQVAVQTGCKAIGIEIRPELTKIANNMKSKLPEISSKVIKKKIKTNKISFETGDALTEDYNYKDATIIFLNNWCFGGELEQTLFRKFEKELKEGTKIICLKDAFPRFRPDSLRFIDSPCQKFKYPWKKFQSCEDAISWDSRLVECVIYEIHDYGCTLKQANALINSLTIIDYKNQPITNYLKPKSRQLLVDEAKAFVKRLLSENFIYPQKNKKQQQQTIEQFNSKKEKQKILKEFENQLFYSTYSTSIECDELSEITILPERKTPRKIIIQCEVNNNKNSPIIQRNIENLTIKDFYSNYYKFKNKIAKKNKNFNSKLFLKRNIKFLHKKSSKKEKFLSFHKRPFDFYDESDFIHVKIQFSSLSILQIHKNLNENLKIPKLKSGLKPNWSVSSSSYDKEEVSSSPVVSPFIRSKQKKNGISSSSLSSSSSIICNDNFIVPSNTIFLSVDSFRALRNSTSDNLKNSTKKIQKQKSKKLFRSKSTTIINNHHEENDNNNYSPVYEISISEIQNSSFFNEKKSKSEILAIKAKTNLELEKKKENSKEIRKSTRRRVKAIPRSAFPKPCELESEKRPSFKDIKTSITSDRPPIFLRRSLHSPTRKRRSMGFYTPSPKKQKRFVQQTIQFKPNVKKSKEKSKVKIKETKTKTIVKTSPKSKKPKAKKPKSKPLPIKCASDPISLVRGKRYVKAPIRLDL